MKVKNVQEKVLQGAIGCGGGAVIIGADPGAESRNGGEWRKSNRPAVVNVSATSREVHEQGAEDALSPPRVVVQFRRVTIEVITTKRNDVGTRSVTTKTAAMRRRMKMGRRKVREGHGVLALSTTMTATTTSSRLQLVGIIIRIHPHATIPSDISWVVQEL